MRWSLLGFVAVIAALQPAAAAERPVEAFAALPAIRNPQMSPDGNRILAIQEDTETRRPIAVVYTVNAPAGTAPVVLPSESEWTIAFAQWVSNDRIMISAGKGTKRPGTRHGDLWTLNRSIFVSADGSNPVRVLDNVESLRYNSSAAWVLDLSIEEPNHVYMPLLELAGSDVLLNLFQVDVNTGRAQRFATGDRGTGGWLMDGRGNVVGRLDQTRKSKVQTLMVPEGERDWRAVASVQSTVDSGIDILGLSEDGKAVVRVAQSGGRNVIARLDLATGKETILFSDPKYDVSGVVSDKWTGRIIGAEIEGQGSEETYFDRDRVSLLKALRERYAGRIVREVSYDLSHQRLIYAVEAPRHPTSYVFLDRAAKVIDDIMPSYPALGAADLGEMTPYDYKARDGLHIPAFITLPPGRKPKNLPAVVMPHGGPDARDFIGFDWWAQFLANRGYVVLQPQFRGSAGYGRAFTEAGFGQWGLKMQDDVSDGVLKMIADGIVDPKRVCIVGASYGGYSALAGATLTPELYACAVSVAGVSDLPKMISYERRQYGRKSGTVLFWISRIGSPDDDSERLRATSPARQAARATAPILLLHGENDTTVPIEQSAFMADALKAAGKPYKFVALPGDDHYLQVAATRLTMLREIETFLTQHIGR